MQCNYCRVFDRVEVGIRADGAHIVVRDTTGRLERGVVLPFYWADDHERSFLEVARGGSWEMDVVESRVA